jgi:soluble lytic murein transglycosylase
MPQTAQFLARRSGATNFSVADLGTPAVNIAYGSYYLRYLLDRYGGSQMLALAAYNGGEANVDRWVAAARERGHRLSDRDIPFPETRAYVERVLQAQRDYRRTYRTELGYR